MGGGCFITLKVPTLNFIRKWGKFPSPLSVRLGCMAPVPRLPLTRPLHNACFANHNPTTWIRKDRALCKLARGIVKAGGAVVNHPPSERSDKALLTFRKRMPLT